MSTRQLLETFEAWRRDGERIVLATVTATAGSTYSKPGAQMLISGSGQFRGLLSGGCLEGDLVEHAKDVLGSATPRGVRYDMRNRDEDELWGLGLGCDGAIDIFLQPLDGQYEPFAFIAQGISARDPLAYALVLESTAGELAPGACVIARADAIETHGMPERLSPPLARAARQQRAAGGATRERISVQSGSVEVLCAVVPLPVRLLVLGGGPDAVPLVRIARELGWYVTVVDHRRAYVERMASAGVDQALETNPAALDANLDPDDFDAAIIMSHHLQSDRAYLRALATSAVPYIGLLGPRARRERLLADLGPNAAALAPRIYGPVGLDLGADTPQGIALAVVAEIHAVLKGRSPRHLSGAPAQMP
jgi:xanthine/CO dehydrogenase XdhC/CoxF family maturation factor